MPTASARWLILPCTSDPWAVFQASTRGWATDCIHDSAPIELSPQNAYIRRLQHQMAERANLISKGQDVHILDTLGAAYAEIGQFKRAREIAQQRLALATQAGDKDLIESIKGQIRLYESERAMREV